MPHLTRTLRAQPQEHSGFCDANGIAKLERANVPFLEPPDLSFLPSNPSASRLALPVVQGARPDPST
jgi:hypothetical protein